MHLIARLWAQQIARGEKPTKVWAVVHRAGSTQPEGYMQCWALHKRIARKLAGKIKGELRLVCLTPGEEV